MGPEEYLVNFDEEDASKASQVVPSLADVMISSNMRKMSPSCLWLLRSVCPAPVSSEMATKKGGFSTVSAVQWVSGGQTEPMTTRTLTYKACCDTLQCLIDEGRHVDERFNDIAVCIGVNNCPQCTNRRPGSPTTTDVLRECEGNGNPALSMTGNRPFSPLLR